MPDTLAKIKPIENGYDLAVVGAGSAGFSAALTAAEEGAKVALVGYGTIGGTCVNVGCVPSKTMIRATEAIHGARGANRFPGLSGEAAVNNWRALIAGKDDLVSTMRQKKYIDLLSEYDDITYMDGAAHLEGRNVTVNGNPLKADKTIITTGASAALPEIPGLADTPYLTSTTALELNTLPESLLVIGGGYIGCELAQMFARAGTCVTLLTRSRLLPEAELEIAEALTGYFQNEKITVRSGLAYRGIERTEKGVAVTVDTEDTTVTVEAQKVLLTTGRSPNTANMGLKEAGVQLTPQGGILVDEYMRTSKIGVYAAGDVTGRDQFVYMAAYGAKLAALNALNGDSLRYDNAAMPWVVFTDPQVAGVGLTEQEARSQGFETKTSIAPLDQVPRALAARDTRGLMKLVADAKTDRLLGAQILAPEGCDSIQTMVLALKYGMTASELGQTIFPYLTTVEGLKLAAQGFGKDVTKLSCCAG